MLKSSSELFPRPEAEGKLGAASLGEHRDIIFQLSASMTSKGRNNVYPASFQTHWNSVAHGPDRAPAGAPSILFAAQSGGGPDIASKLAGRFSGQQRFLPSLAAVCHQYDYYFPNPRLSLLAAGDTDSRQSAMDV